MLIKKTTTSKKEEMVEVELPLFLKSKSNSTIAMVAEKGVMKIIGNSFVDFSEFSKYLAIEDVFSSLFSDYIPCSEEEFNHHFNQAIGLFQSQVNQPA